MTGSERSIVMAVALYRSMTAMGLHINRVGSAMPIYNPDGTREDPAREIELTAMGLDDPAWEQSIIGDAIDPDIAREIRDTIDEHLDRTRWTP